MKKFFEKLIALTIAIITVFSFTTAIYACDYCPAFSFPFKSPILNYSAIIITFYSFFSRANCRCSRIF